MFVCLNSEKENANKVKDFWPISFITSVYKILAEVLESRWKRELLSTISKSKGESVAESVLG